MSEKHVQAHRGIVGRLDLHRKEIDDLKKYCDCQQEELQMHVKALDHTSEKLAKLTTRIKSLEGHRSMTKSRLDAHDVQLEAARNDIRKHTRLKGGW
jgi:uncharacterized coiled-coil DUF342 family protein